MIALYDFIVDLCDNLLSLMASERLTPFFGVPFVYVLIAFFIVWVVTNIFIIRPFVGGIFNSGIAKNHYNTKEKSVMYVDPKTGEIIDD